MAATQRVTTLIRSPWLLAPVIFGLALLPRVTDLGIFVGPDEFYWLTGSATFAEALATGNLAKTYHAGQPGVTLMWVETVGAWLTALVRPGEGPVLPDIESMAMLAQTRRVVAVANAGLIVAIVLLVRPLFGVGVAWLTGFLLAFDPFFLTETRALRTEALVANFNTLALLSLLLYMKTPSLRRALLAGMLTGLALLSKISAVALGPVALLIFLGVAIFRPTEPPGRRWLNFFKTAALYGGVALLTIVLLWPALWVGPVQVYQQMYDFSFSRVIEGGGGGKSFFLGEAYPDEAPGLLFYPVVLLYRSSPLLWLGLGLLLASVILGRLSRTAKIMAGLLLLYLLLYLALITPSELKFDRYTVPMLPTLTILAAWGLVLGWQWLEQRAPRLAGWGWLPVLLILFGQIILARPHHPYYYTYWNPLLGGLPQAATVLPIGIGGEGLDQAAAYLDGLPDAETISVASANSQKIRPLFRGETIAMDNLDGAWVQADYGLLYISQVQREKHAEDIVAYLARQEPLHTVQFEGVEYAWIYPGPAAHYYGGGHKLEGRGTLFGYDLSTTTLAAGESLDVSLYWRNEGQRANDRFFVRLMDLDGYIWAEGVAQPRPGFEDANRRENSIVESEVTLTLPVGMPPGDYFFKPGFRTAEGQLIGYFELPGDAPTIAVTPAAHYPDTLARLEPQSFPINDDLTLLGYELEPVEATLAPAWWLTLYWRKLTAAERDYVILLRLLDGEREVAYWLGRPVRSGYPSTEWQAGQIVQDPWQLAPPVEAGPGRYQLEVALFDADSEAELGRHELTTVVVEENRE